MFLLPRLQPLNFQVATTELPPIKVYTRRPRVTSDSVRELSSQLEDAPIDAPNNVPNDVPISAPSEELSDSGAPSDTDTSSGSDLPSPTYCTSER